jgi:hypothetical protein
MQSTAVWKEVAKVNWALRRDSVEPHGRAEVAEVDAAAALLSRHAVPEDLVEDGGAFCALRETLLARIGSCHDRPPPGPLVILHADGLTEAEIEGHVAALYGGRVAPDIVRRAAHAVLAETQEWRGRPLDPFYPIVFLDTVRMTLLGQGATGMPRIRVAQAISAAGAAQMLGLWLQRDDHEAAWRADMAQLRRRGVAEILCAVIDRGCPGFRVVQYPLRA